MYELCVWEVRALWLERGHCDYHRGVAQAPMFKPSAHRKSVWNAVASNESWELMCGRLLLICDTA